MSLACVKCVAEFERREKESLNPAFVVYKGESLCNGHFNTVRGHAKDFARYPKAEPTPPGRGYGAMGQPAEVQNWLARNYSYTPFNWTLEQVNEARVAMGYAPYGTVDNQSAS